MICKECGAQIPDNATECEFCGAKIKADTNDTSVSAEDNRNNEFTADSVRNTDEKPEEIFDDNEKRRREQMRRMMENKKQQLSEIEKRRVEKRQRQKRNRIMLVGAICAAAVAAAGIGTYYVAENVGEKAIVDESPVPTATAVSTPAAFTPAPSPTAAPSPQIFTSPAPNDASSGSQSTHSWTASGSSSNGSSSGGSSNASASGKSSSGGSSNGSASGKSSSGGSSNGSSNSKGSSSGGSSSQTVKPSGKSSNAIASQLATGGEVLYDNSTGKYLMTFTVGSTRYYANVSPGSTTEQIQNKPYTVTAQPTSQTYDGNTVYEITDLTNYEGDYILANSGTKLLTNSDIKGMSKYDLALARNEIYARHGRKFQTAEYNTYFSGKSWYKLNPNYNYSDDNSNLNETERKNVQFILDAERR